MLGSMSDKLKFFFHPKSIAILGASQDLNSLSGRPIKYLKAHGYGGEVYPINPRHEEIAGYRCYRSIQGIQGVPDLVLIVIRADRVLEALEQCAGKGCKNIIIGSSGFAEVGAAGETMQEQIREIAGRHDLLICGPNCQGILNLKAPAAVTFSAALEAKDLVPGPLGYVS